MVEQIVNQETGIGVRKISFEDYLRLYDGQFVELVNGEVQSMSPITIKHDKLQAFLRGLLDSFLEERPLGWVLQAPFVMRLGGAAHGREPDLLFVSNAHADRLHETYLDGAADLAIEIISPESVERDQVTKFAEYEAGGVLEYLLLDPILQTIVLYRLDDDKKYRRIELDPTGDLTLVTLPGFRLSIAIFWQENLPRGSKLDALVQAMLKTKE